MSALSVKNLTKVYATGKTALRGIDLEVAEGDFFALLGQNGAGKSTTIGIICSLVTKTSGKIHVFGHDTDVELAEAKSLIGIVPQEMNFSLFEKISQILINQAGYYGITKKSPWIAWKCISRKWVYGTCVISLPCVYLAV